MEIEIFTICDSAQDVNGKLNIFGTFDVINAHELPAIHPTLSIVVRVRLSEDDSEPMYFRLSIIDSNNKEILPPLARKLEAPTPTPSGEQGRGVSIIAVLNQLEFNAYGKHLVKLEINNEEIKSFPFIVRKV